jgi:hypothetical protein
MVTFRGGKKPSRAEAMAKRSAGDPIGKAERPDWHKETATRIKGWTKDSAGREVTETRPGRFISKANEAAKKASIPGSVASERARRKK